MSFNSLWDRLGPITAAAPDELSNAQRRMQEQNASILASLDSLPGFTPPASDPEQGVLHNVLGTLFGRRESILTPEEAGARARDRRDAGESARAAGENPGEEFMNAPGLGGSGGSPLDLLRGIISLFGAGGGR